VKAVAKWTGVVLAGLMLLGLLAWTGLFFYWQHKIRGCIRVMESPTATGRERDDAFILLTTTGCRSLPYIIDAVDPSNEDSRLAEAAEMVFGWFGSKSGYSDDPEPQFQEHYQLLRDCWQGWNWSPDSRRRGAKRLRKWWTEWGPHYHSWWRVWTSSCRKGT
jgi:hypothetical protein